MMKRTPYPDYPSLDVVFDLTKERIEAQLTQVDAIDSKSNFILGSATAVISAGVIVQGLTASSSSLLLTNRLLQSLPMLLLFASYLVTMLSAVIACRLNTYKGVARPETLFEQYLSEQVKTTKTEVSKYMVEAYKHNAKLIEKKAFCTQFSLYALLAEVTVLSGVVVVQTIR
jgi:hypothetical protein